MTEGQKYRNRGFKRTYAILLWISIMISPFLIHSTPASAEMFSQVSINLDQFVESDSVILQWFPNDVWDAVNNGIGQAFRQYRKRVRYKDVLLDVNNSESLLTPHITNVKNVYTFSDLMMLKKTIFIKEFCAQNKTDYLFFWSPNINIDIAAKMVRGSLLIYYPEPNIIQSEPFDLPLADAINLNQNVSNKINELIAIIFGD